MVIVTGYDAPLVGPVVVRYDDYPAVAASGPTYSLTMNAGTYALSGQAIGLKCSRFLALAQGSYALAGQSLGVSSQRKIVLMQGSYILTGEAAGLIYSAVGGLGNLTETSTRLLALPYSTRRLL